MSDQTRQTERFRAERSVVDRVPGIAKFPMHASAAVIFDGFAFLSGIMAADYQTGLAEDARVNPGLPFHEAPAAKQTEHIYASLARVLSACDASLDDVVVVHQFLTGKGHFEPYRRVAASHWGTDRPPSTALPCGSLAVPGAVLEVDVMASLPTSGRLRERVSSADSPEVLGSYSQGMKFGDWVILAGATPADHTRTSAPYPGALGTAVAPNARVDPNLWYGSQIQRQVEYIMLEKQLPVLEAAGSSLDRIVKAEVYLSEMETDYLGFQEAWRKIFPDNPPATTIVPIEGFGSTGSRIEIGLIALTNESGLRVEPVQSDDALPPLGHHPQAVRAGNLLFLSTVIAADRNGLVKSAVPNPGFPFAYSQAELEMEACLGSAAAICEAAGTSLDFMLKRRNVYLDLRDIYATESAVRRAWPTDPPASSNMGSTVSMAVPGCRISMDMVCGIPDATDS